jgi:hypothetical protein
MKTGAIYVYNDPATGKHMYVGSVQRFETLMGRHKVHLKRKSKLIGPWLRTFPVGREPKPIAVRRVEFGDVWLLLTLEWHHIVLLGTHISNGGFNQMDPTDPLDHVQLSVLGNIARAKWAKEHPKEALNIASTAGKVGGRITGRKNVDSGHWKRFCRLGNHVNNHLNLNRVNLNCALCFHAVLCTACMAGVEDVVGWVAQFS